MENSEKKEYKDFRRKQITFARLKNIALYYLQRFDSSEQNLRQVLERRVKSYAYENPEFDRSIAQRWIDEIISTFKRVGYINDHRYAEQKVLNYIASGKPERYIKQKLQQKGVAEDIINSVVNNIDIDEYTAAKHFAIKKKIGPYRTTSIPNKNYFQKDFGTMIRAGFSYETIKEVLGSEKFDENI